MKILKIVLPVLIVVLGYLLIKSIADPIRFEKQKKEVESGIIEQLELIRNSQIAYRSKYRRYTSDFDTLIHFIRTDSLLIVTKTGDPEDSLSVVTVDTTFIAAIDSLLPTGFVVDSLPFVPYGKRAKFKMKAGTLEKGGVIVPVFEVVDPKPIDPERPLQVGSMTEVSSAGNWE